MARRTGLIRLAAAILAVGLLPIAQSQPSPAPPPVARTASLRPPGADVQAGRRLYLEGIGRDGRPPAAIVQGDVAATSATLACVNCHKRSGLGASEGGRRAAPVTATALFGGAAVAAGVLPARRAPPYQEATLARALREGIGSDGRSLDPLMPRYRLDDGDARALHAYLRTLGGDGPEHGVTGTELEVATIVAESAPAAEREAVVAVVTRFVELKNRGTRREGERAQASRRQMYGERHARGFRRWNLSVWTLRGDPTGWAAQLESLYAARAPFVVVSGATGDHWREVHAFCERQGLPCVLPVTELPGGGDGNHYNVYISEGVVAQARVTARAALAAARTAPGRTLLVAPDTPRGRAARTAFESEWRAGGGSSLAVEMLADAMPDWPALLQQHRAQALVAWVGRDALAPLATAANRMPDAPARIYTAEGFSPWGDMEPPAPFGERVRHVYPYRLPAPGVAQFPREQTWLRSQGLDGLSPVPAAMALFACHATGEALAGLADNYSREYLLETLEHMLDGTNMTTLYPLTTLGTGQRFLAKGAYVVRPGRGDARGLLLGAGWVQL